MNNIAFIDVGELGWSLYLSAHMRWLKQNGSPHIAVITMPDRRCLYEGIADEVVNVPDTFNKKYDINMQDSFKIRKKGWDEIEAFFLSSIPDGYSFVEHEKYPKMVSENRVYKPYKYSTLRASGKEILVFPRHRPLLWVLRNLPKIFYIDLIEQLCEAFPNLIIRTVGTKGGAYDIKVNKLNYINWIGRGETLQDMIDNCQSAVAAVGGQSAPPKLSLLQGVPTFIIGHEKARHVEKDNPMDTKIDFYVIDKRAYRTFNDPTCINEVVCFVRRAQ